MKTFSLHKILQFFFFRWDFFKKDFSTFWKLVEKYALVVMNYLGICLGYLRSVKC